MGAEQPEDPRQPRPKPVRPLPARPTPARADRDTPPRTVRDAGGEGRPTPVRSSLEGDDAVSAPEVAVDAESANVEVGGTRWVVRVRGRTNAGADTGTAPLLLLGFFPDESAAAPRVEAFVVGRRLADLTSRQLEGAFQIARPPNPPGNRPFFPEASSRGRRDG